MSTVTPIRTPARVAASVCDIAGATVKPVPVCDADGVIIERVDAASARRLALAPNAKAVYKKRGGIVRILLKDVGCDYDKRTLNGDPKRYTYLDKSFAMPQGVHTLRHLPDSTQSLYRLSVSDCLSASKQCDTPALLPKAA